MSFKLLKLHIMFWFPSDPKFIKLKKQFQELKILTSQKYFLYKMIQNVQYDVFYLTPVLKTSDPYSDRYFDFVFYRLVHNN